MPGYLLNQESKVDCIHGGHAQATQPSPRVKVSNRPVVTQPNPHSVSGCPYTLPGPISSPCVTAQWYKAATRVKASGEPVLLKDSQATCTPNGTGVKINKTQTRVKGI